MQNIGPTLISCKPLKPEYEDHKEIHLSHVNVSLGRGLQNLVVIPFCSISRTHCILKKTNDEWVIEDYSTFGIEVNGNQLGKGVTMKLSHGDIITLEPTKEFVYKFYNPSDDDFEIPRKRIKLEPDSSSDIINNVKMKFEESQNYEMKHIEEKIQNAKQMQSTSKILKQQLQLDMNRKIQQLETDFAAQIENLQGEKNEVELQKAALIEERDALLATVKVEMEGKISELMEQIQKHNETESELLNENNSLKEKLLKEREDFLSELSRETSSKQDMLDKLEAKMREQEEIRLREKQELEDSLRKETELLRLAKEKELRELEEQKKQREQELIQELNNIKKDLEQKVEQTEQQRLKAEQLLNEQMEQMKKLSDVEKLKMEQILKEREKIKNKLAEAEADQKLNEVKMQIQDREKELALIAAESMQKQAERSSKVISSMQAQLQIVKSQLESVETEKNTLLESISHSDPVGEGTSKETTLAQVGELMESELQCSICAELFVAATTLNCSHTFCKYCITMWKKKKKDCPICRAAITSECKSLVLDSFIEKMVQNLTEDMKRKREELLKFREELETELARQRSAEASRGSRSSDESEYNSEYEDIDLEGGEEEEYEEFHEHDYYYESPWHRRRYGNSDSDSGSNENSDGTSDTDAITESPTSVAATDNAAIGETVASGSSNATTAGAAATVSNNTAERRNDNGAIRRRRGNVPGVPGSFYGGYGRCYSCGSRGHWAPGCPFR